MFPFFFAITQHRPYGNPVLVLDLGEMRRQKQNIFPNFQKTKDGLLRLLNTFIQSTKATRHMFFVYRLKKKCESFCKLV